jgi:hypothetical protein
MKNLYCAHSIKNKFFAYFQIIIHFQSTRLYNITFTPIKFKPYFTPILVKLLNVQVISSTCRIFVPYFAKSYHKYGRYVLKLLRAHNQNTSFAPSYLKRTQNVPNMCLCSSCVQRLIEMGGEYMGGNLFLNF